MLLNIIIVVGCVRCGAGVALSEAGQDVTPHDAGMYHQTHITNNYPQQSYRSDFLSAQPREKLHCWRRGGQT